MLAEPIPGKNNSVNFCAFRDELPRSESERMWCRSGASNPRFCTTFAPPGCFG
ncbi:MAG: hypothetical protein ACRDZN_11250 [Acidimicrobiales bacterium]